MVFQAQPSSMAVEFQLNVLARLDEALATLRHARRELVAANQLLDKRKAG